MWTIVLQIYFSPLVSSFSMLLFSVPFCYKFRRRSYFGVRVAECVLCEQLILFALSVLATVLLKSEFSFETYYIEWARVLFSLICFALYVLILELLYDEHFVQLMYVATAGTALYEITQSVYSLLLNASGINSMLNFLIATPDSPVNIYSVIFFVLAYVAVFLQAFFCSAGLLREYTKSTAKPSIFICCCFSLSYFLW